MFNNHNTYTQQDLIGFASVDLRNTAIDILTSAGMNGLEGQRDLDNNMTLRFSDPETASEAFEFLIDGANDEN